MDTFREYRFRVRSYECGKDGFATLPTFAGDDVFVRVAEGSDGITRYHRVFAADGKDHVVAVTR